MVPVMQRVDCEVLEVTGGYRGISGYNKGRGMGSDGPRKKGRSDKVYALRCNEGEVSQGQRPPAPSARTGRTKPRPFARTRCWASHEAGCELDLFAALWRTDSRIWRMLRSCQAESMSCCSRR